MQRRKRFMALLATIAFALTACTSGDSPSQSELSASLPSPNPVTERQILGDTTTTAAREITLYRASEGTMELTALTRSIRAGADGNLLKNVLEELLASMSGGSSPQLGGAQIALEDVEFGCGLATVCLSIDAVINLSDQDYLLLCASIANTLLEIEGVRAVNILTGNRSNAICALPSGVFSSPIDNVPATYAQLQSASERLSPNGSAALENEAYLYFPTHDGRYLLPEVQGFVFTSDDYASALIDALYRGPQEHKCCFSAIPARLDLLVSDPEIVVTREGERVLELRLSNLIFNYLALTGIEPWQLYASLVLTLTSFLPELDAIRATIDGARITECNLGGQMLHFPGGLMRRSDFSSCIGSSAWLYFPDGEGGLICRECAVSQASAISAKNLLTAMIQSDGEYESAFPEGIGPEDILGVAIEGRTAVVNLSGNFYACCQSLDKRQERALIYAMINTLTELDSIGAVSFLVEGRQVDSLVGSVYLRTALIPEPGLVRADSPQAPVSTQD